MRANTHRHTHQIPSEPETPDKCQPSSSWTDIDGYLGLFLQSVVHLRTEMESISAWLAARVTVGQGNLAAWHLGWYLSELLSYLSFYIQSLPQTNSGHTQKNNPQLCSETHKLVFSWNETKSGRSERLLSLIWLLQTITQGSQKKERKKIGHVIQTSFIAVISV